MLVRLDFARSENNFCLYAFRNRNTECYIVLYSNDILIGGNSETQMQEIFQSKATDEIYEC